MHSKKNASSGFTLIELLVVIAIIGLLSSVVLASLNTARSKGSDASIKSNMANILTQAAVYYDTNLSYATTTASTCAGGLFADTTVAQAVSAVDSANGTGAVACSASTGSGGAFAITSALTTTGQFWCVDSSGVKKQTAALHNTATYVCP